jgi:hypothetical protein
MSHRPRLAVAIFAMLTLSACKSVVDDSKHQFSTEFTCPIDRVEAHARPDLHLADLRVKPTPPKDIAADRERLQMWQDQQAKLAPPDDGKSEIVELRGCGRQAVYVCRRVKGVPNDVLCLTQHYPPGVTPSW